MLRCHSTSHCVVEKILDCKEVEMEVSDDEDDGEEEEEAGHEEPGAEVSQPTGCCRGARRRSGCDLSVVATSTDNVVCPACWQAAAMHVDSLEPGQLSRTRGQGLTPGKIEVSGQQPCEATPPCPVHLFSHIVSYPR